MWDYFLEIIQYVDDKKFNYKTSTLTTTLHINAGEANPYVRFVYVPQKFFDSTQGQVSRSMNADTINEMYNIQWSTKKILCEELEGYLYQTKKSIDFNKKLHSTFNLIKTFNKPAVKANPYVQFWYGLHKRCDHTWRKFSVSMNADTINMNKQVNINNQRC